MPDRILITGDFLRPALDHWAPSQHFNIRWLQQILSAQIRLVCGVTPEMLAWSDHSVDGGLSSKDIAQFYELLDAPQTIDGWAKISHLSDLPSEAEAFLAKKLSGALLIGFETPRVVEDFVAKHGLTLIDMTIHPVRFMDDIFLGMRTNNRAMNETLARYAIDEALISLAAGVQSAAAQRELAFRPIDGALLFLMQVREDRSQISEGAFIYPQAYQRELQDLFAAYEHVYIKRHPFQQAPATFDYLMDLGASVEETDLNLYRLMATSQIAGVGSFSSSASYEAVYFGKQPHFILQPPNRFALNGAIPTDGEYVGIFDAFLSTGFWADLLGDHMPAKGGGQAALPFKPNRLRASLRSDWGFSRVDTDFFAEQAVGRRISRVEARLSSRPLDQFVDADFPLDVARWMHVGDRSTILSNGGVSVWRGAPASHVVYGPYLRLPKGHYRLVMEIEEAARGFFAGPAAQITLEAAHTDMLAQSNSAIWDRQGRRARAVVDFELVAAMTEDIEFRVWADEDAAFDIMSLRLERL
jgi:hypothetical protein